MGRKRWLLVFMLFLATTINYVDRQNISVAGPEIAKTFGLGPGALGIVFSCFFWSYILLILPMGLLVDRFGARLVMTSGMVLWAVGSVATGSAVGLATLVGARLLLGVGESSSYPAGNQIVREWAPRSERGRMVSLFNAGSSAGPAVGIVLTSALLSAVGWRAAFYVIGAGTLVWVVIWAAFYRSPEKARWLGTEERAYVLEQRDPETAEPVARMRFRDLLGQPVMWGLLLTHGCQVYSMYLFLTWLPSYLRTARHLDLLQSGWLGMLPYLVTTVGVFGAGALSDHLVRNADLSTGVRRRMMVVLMVLASCVFFVPLTDSLVVMEALIIAAILFATAANTLNYALAADLVHDKASGGAVFGLLVLGGNSFGFAAPILTGFIIERTQKYTLSFVVAAVLLLVGVILSLAVVRRPLQPRWVRESRSRSAAV